MSASNSLGEGRSRRTRNRARPISSPAWCMWYAASSRESWCALRQARTSASLTLPLSLSLSLSLYIYIMTASATVPTRDSDTVTVPPGFLAG